MHLKIFTSTIILHCLESNYFPQRNHLQSWLRVIFWHRSWSNLLCNLFNSILTTKVKRTKPFKIKLDQIGNESYEIIPNLIIFILLSQILLIWFSNSISLPYIIHVFILLSTSQHCTLPHLALPLFISSFCNCIISLYHTLHYQEYACLALSSSILYHPFFLSWPTWSCSILVYHTLSDHIISYHRLVYQTIS